jgi:peptidoglycan/LPS O-acetylase OafA/YrhL
VVPPPTAAVLGRSSYSFYLLHTLIIDYVSIPLLLPLMASRLLCVLLTFAVTWALSILLFVYYEEPLNLFLRQRLRSKEKWPGVPSASFK